jgi:hypothetical protein
VGRPQANLQQLGFRIDQEADPLAGGEASFAVLRIRGLRAATLAYLLFLLTHLLQ